MKNRCSEPSGLTSGQRKSNEEFLHLCRPRRRPSVLPSGCRRDVRRLFWFPALLNAYANKCHASMNQNPKLSVRCQPGNLDHHLRNNNGTFWCHLTFHFADFTTWTELKNIPVSYRLTRLILLKHE